MPDRRRRNCRCCGRHDSECGPISWTGNCLACAKALLAENVIGIADKQGYAYRRQLRGIAKYAERALLDVQTGER